ncbi:MAG TPA: VIT domain-containing protein [Blastocatellia bacterium]|nr:VIT domain-containing protein [Blastocatellia bacterium]
MPEDPNEPVTVLSAEESAKAPETTPVERLIAQEIVPNHGQPVFSIRPPSRKPGTFLFFAGVFLPSVAVFIEITTGLCAKTFFDPIPTVWHKILVIATPLANLYVIRELRKDDAEYHWRIGAANSLAVVVSVYYTLVYLPVIPLALVALVFAGLGLLPLSPVSSLIASAVCLRRLRMLAKGHRAIYGASGGRLRGFGYGLALSAMIMIAVEAPVIVTQIWIAKAASDSGAESARAIDLLRRYGSQRALLNACKPRRDLDSLFGVFIKLRYSAPPEQARTIFYRVTGKPYASAGNGGLNAFAFDDGFRELDETGELRGSSRPDLSLASSRIDGSFDPDAALGYLEWTLVFKNASAIQQEARAQLALPPGGVVSRLTLWVNGEEREAAFAERGKVQAAYDAVVRTRRDPVLVTTNGGDVVNVQCFPVQPDGEMKIRLGVTAPMQIEMTKAAANSASHNESQSESWMRLPYFIERNFRVDDSVTHSVWIESKRPLESSSNSLKPEHPSASLFAVRGALPHIEMAKAFPAVRAARSALVNQAWTRDPFSKNGEVIEQRIEPKSSTTPMRAVFVIDGSAQMRDQASSIAEALANMPERGEFAILVASDEVVELAPMQPSSSANAAKAADALKRFDFRGGQDNLAAITQAWEIAARNPESVIVWIHEPVPIFFNSTDELRQRLERRPSGAQLFDLQTRRGANLIAENLSGVAAVNRITRMGDTPQELRRLLSRFSGGSQQFSTTRSKLPGLRHIPSSNSKETSKHLARLWAAGEVTNLLLLGDDRSSDVAMNLASSYQLVTPLTGAVVLETQEQYRRAGLEPVKSGTVPTIPEPEEWLLMLSALLVLSWVLFRRRFRRQCV